MASYYQDEKRTPVSLGPREWTTLDPGTTVQGAVVNGHLEDFCTSIKVFEQKYVSGQEIMGGCW